MTDTQHESRPTSRSPQVSDDDYLRFLRGEPVGGLGSPVRPDGAVPGGRRRHRADNADPGQWSEPSPWSVPANGFDRGDPNPGGLGGGRWDGRHEHGHDRRDGGPRRPEPDPFEYRRQREVQDDPAFPLPRPPAFPRPLMPQAPPAPRALPPAPPAPHAFVPAVPAGPSPLPPAVPAAFQPPGSPFPAGDPPRRAGRHAAPDEEAAGSGLYGQPGPDLWPTTPPGPGFEPAQPAEPWRPGQPGGQPWDDAEDATAVVRWAGPGALGLPPAPPDTGFDLDGPTEVIGRSGLADLAPIGLPPAETGYPDSPYPEYPDDPPDGTHRAAHRLPSRRPRWMRILGWSGAFLGIVVVACGSYALYEYHKISNNIHRVDALATNDASIKDAAKQVNAENFLLIGSDTRAGENERYGQVGGQRSDTTILAHLSPDRQHATMISFPRDAWVTIPPCQTAAGQVIPEHDGMFNSAFEAGGPSCTVRTLQRLTGISITHYVQVDFTGFKSMVDALGGVPVCSAEAVSDRDSGLRLRAGQQMLRGEQALAFVRARHAMGDGSDLDRIKRQQLFLGSMLRVATGHRILFNPVQLTKFLDAASRSVTLDRQTTLSDLRRLAGQLRGLDPRRVKFLTAPIANRDYDPTGQRATGGGRVLLDAAQGELLWRSLINDKPATKGSTAAAGRGPAAATVTLPPEQVSVRVLNGVGTAGLAGQVASALSTAGFLPASTGNASTRVTASMIRYAPANRDAAVTLAAAVPGSMLSADPTLGPALELVVGSTYRGVQPVRVGQRLMLIQAPPSAAASTAPRAQPSPQASINGGTSACV